MTDVILQMMRYTRDLLNLSEDSIKDGRTNFNQQSPSASLVVIDSLAEVHLSHSQSFDGDALPQTLYTNSYERATITVNFYGDNALSRAQLFQNLVLTQSGADAAYGKNLTVYSPSAPVNLRKLTGNRYVNRYEVTVEVAFNNFAEIGIPSFLGVDLDDLLFEE